MFASRQSFTLSLPSQSHTVHTDAELFKVQRNSMQTSQNSAIAAVYTVGHKNVLVYFPP